MDLKEVCEILLKELDNLVEKPADRKLSDRITRLKELRFECPAIFRDDAVDAKQNRASLDKLRATASNGNDDDSIFRNDVTKDGTPSPFANDIITLDDFEFKDEEKISCNEGVFKNLNFVEDRPVHLAIFVQYLISYSSPNGILFHIICKSILKLNKSEFLPAACSLYCNFLHCDAPLKIQVEGSLPDRLLSCLRASNSSSDSRCKNVKVVLEEVVRLNELDLHRSLREFNDKRAIGLGIFYGEQFLHDGLDERSSRLIIADTLWTNFELNFLDSSNEKSASLAAALATVLRIVNFQPLKNKDYLDVCSSFLPSRVKRKKCESSLSQLSLYGHDCKPFVYSEPTTCHFCSKPVCSVGNVGFYCKNCGQSLHKTCLQLDSRICSRRIGAATDKRNSTPNCANLTNPVETTPESHRSSKIKVFCQASVDPISAKNAEFCDSDVEYSEEDWEKTIDSKRLVAMTTVDKRKRDAINEFITTEQLHVRSLKVMFNVYYIPMCKKCSPDFVKLIFPNLKSLIQLHVNLNNDLKRIKDLDDDEIIKEFADVLVKHFTKASGERLEEYTALFCQKQSSAISQIDRVQKKDPKFGQILAAASNNKQCRRQNLKDFLPTIMQRFTRYPLLVDNVLKYAPADSGEHARLREVRTSARKMVKSVDAIISDYANARYVNYLVKNVEKQTPDPFFYHPSVVAFTNFNFSDHQLDFFGDLQWRLGKNRVVEVQILLFNDVVMLLQHIDRRLVLKFELSIDSDKAKSYSTFSPILNLKDILIKNVANDPLSFFLICVSTKEPQMFQMLCQTAEEKNAWHRRMQNAKDRLESTMDDLITAESNGGKTRSNGADYKNDSNRGVAEPKDSDLEPSCEDSQPVAKEAKCFARSSFVQDSRLDMLRQIADIVKQLKASVRLEDDRPSYKTFMDALKGVQSLSDEQVVKVSNLLMEQVNDLKQSILD